MHAEGVEVSAKVTDFQKVVEETMAVAISEAIATAVSGADCSVSVTACAQAGECAARSNVCSGAGIDGVLACCDAGDVCASVLGSGTFICMASTTVDAIAGSEVLECS